MNDFVKENLTDHKNVSNLYNESKSYLNTNIEELGLQEQLSQNNMLAYDKNSQSFSAIVQGNEISLSEN